MSELMTCSSCSEESENYIVVCDECEHEETEQIEESLNEKYVIELVNVEDGELTGEYIGLAPNFSRMEKIKDLKYVMKFGTIEDAELFQKYCKKSSGGLDCVISKI